MPIRRMRLAKLALLAFSPGLLAGCARAVGVDPPQELDPAAAQACSNLAEQLPATLSTVGARRQVTPESLLTAAWGDPPVAMRCGVVTPTALGPTSSLVSVDGIDWFAEELTGGYLMTTVGRVANVELTVPASAGPAPGVAADLGPAIAGAVPAS